MVVCGAVGAPILYRGLMNFAFGRVLGRVGMGMLVLGMCQ